MSLSVLDVSIIIFFYLFHEILFLFFIAEIAIMTCLLCVHVPRRTDTRLLSPVRSSFAINIFEF